MRRRAELRLLIRHQPDDGCLIANFAILRSPGVQENVPAECENLIIQISSQMRGILCSRRRIANAHASIRQ